MTTGDGDVTTTIKKSRHTSQGEARVEVELEVRGYLRLLGETRCGFTASVHSTAHEAHIHLHGGRVLVVAARCRSVPPHHLVELALKLLDLVRQLPRVTAPKHGETGNERSTHRARGKRRLGSFIACAAVALPLERIIHVLLLRHIADIAAIVCCAEE